MSERAPIRYLAAALLFMGAGCALPFAQGPSGTAKGPACDHDGLVYPIGQSRPAGDGCNVCTCAKAGWECTRLACVAGSEGVGAIQGGLVYDSEELPPLRVCAVRSPDAKEFCVQTLGNTPSFSLNVPEGDYRIYAQTIEGENAGRKAYYTAAVACGLGPECLDRSPLAVAVKPGEVHEALPHDWEPGIQVESISLTPAKYADLYWYYQDGAVLNVRTKDAVSVELFYTRMKKTAGEEEDLAAKPMGEAERIVGDGPKTAFDVWRMPVPPTFEAGRVWAEAEAADGRFSKSSELQWVRPAIRLAAPTSGGP
jgi:hypothetical protein